MCLSGFFKTLFKIGLHFLSGAGSASTGVCERTIVSAILALGAEHMLKTFSPIGVHLQ